MKEQILALERTDDLHSVHDKILRAQASRLILLWPARETPPFRILDLVLMRRWAATIGSDLVIVSADPAVGKTARQAGIACFPSLSRAALAALAPSPAKLQPTPTHRRHILRPTPPLRQAAQRMPQGYRVGLFCAAIILPLFAIGLSLPDAVIRASFPARTLSASVALPSQACTTLTSNITLSERRAATGRIFVPVAYAEGSAVITNTTDHGLNLPAGLQLSTDQGIVFLTTTGLILPAGRAQNLAIRATEPGPEGNLPAGALTRIDGPMALSLKVVNPSALSGGASQWRTAVTKADLDALYASLSARLLSEAEAGMNALAGSTMSIVRDSLNLDIDPEDKPEFQANTPSETVSWTLHAKASALACLNEMLRIKAEDALKTEILPEETLFPETIQASIQLTSPGRTMLLASGKAARIPDQQELLPALRLRTLGGAETILTDQFHAIGPVSIEIHPDWFPLLPPFVFRMEFLPRAQ